MGLTRLSKKLLAFLLPLTAASVLLLSAASWLVVRRTLVRAAEEQAYAIVSGYDDFPAVIQALKARDPEPLQVPLLDLIKGGAAGAAALDARGQVVAEAHRSLGAVVQELPAAQAQLRYPIETVERVTAGGRPMLQVALPVHERASAVDGQAAGGTRIGTVVALLPLDDALHKADEIALLLSALLAGAALCGLTALLGFLAGTLAPLHRLSGAIREIQAGRIGATTAGETSDDEVGELAREFNKMSRTLAETTVSKDFLDAVFDQMLSPLIVTDRAGGIERLNRSALAALGGEPRDWLGKRAADLFVPPAPVLAGEPQGGERALAVPGGTIPVLCTAAPYVDKNGRQGAIIVLKDIRLRKKAEEAERLREREAHSRQFFAMVTHEFRTPLAAIQGFAETLKKGSFDDKAARDEFLGIIERNAARLGRLVDELLDLSRLELGARAGAGAVTDLAPFLTALCAELEPLAARAGVALKAVLAPALPVAVCETDARRLFENLCANAISYTPAGGRVDLIARLEGNRVVVVVQDTGVGIAKADLDKIFEPFFRAGKNKKSRGSGIGLASAKAVVESCGGFIAVDSEVGRGTTFRVFLPVSAAAGAGAVPA